MTNNFKNPTVYKTDLLNYSEVLTLMARDDFEGLIFTPCTETQIRSFGFSDDSITSLEYGNFVLNFKFGERKLIDAEVKTKTALSLKKLEDEQGFPATKKQRDDAKADVIFELVPKAFEKVIDVKAFYHHKTAQLIVDNAAVSGTVISMMIKLLSTFKTTTLHVDGLQHSLTKCLGDCIELDTDYALGRFGYADKLHFKNSERDEVKYTGDYDPEQVSDLIANGHQLEMARLSSNGVSFDLTKDLKIKNLSFEFSENVQDQFDTLDDADEYEKALTLYQLDLMAELAVDLVKVFEEKSMEYKNA